MVNLEIKLCQLNLGIKIKLNHCQEIRDKYNFQTHQMNVMMIQMSPSSFEHAQIQQNHMQPLWGLHDKQSLAIL